MPFPSLCLACTVVTPETRYHERMHDWSEKRNSLLVQMQDYPALVADFKQRHKEPHPTIEGMIRVDQAPVLRLMNACESTTNTLYSLAELSAQFANLASKGVIPSSFNALRKKVLAGYCEPELVETLGGFEWYEKVREMRTEWAHFSTPFIGLEKEEPILVIRCYRRDSDRKHFKQMVHCSIPDLVSWTKNAIPMIDNFAGYLLKKFVLPKFDLDAVFGATKRDSTGTPIIKDNKFVVEQTTVREYLISGGLDLTKWM